MPFLDEVSLHLVSGKGGNGCVSFAREKHMPRGGPDGGNGGDGGDILMVARVNRNTFDDLKGRRLWRAGSGGPGDANNRAGRRGDDLLIELPVGTIVKDAARSATSCSSCSARRAGRDPAGRQGRPRQPLIQGPTRQTPRNCDPGAPATERRVRLELQLLADVGLVGLPNAGKSACSRRSRRRGRRSPTTPSTLQPRIGVVEHDWRQITVADLPA